MCVRVELSCVVTFRKRTLERKPGPEGTWMSGKELGFFSNKKESLVVSEPRSDYVKPWPVLSSYERYDPSESLGEDTLQTHKLKVIFSSKGQNTLWTGPLCCTVL